MRDGNVAAHLSRSWIISCLKTLHLSHAKMLQQLSLTISDG